MPLGGAIRFDLKGDKQLERMLKRLGPDVEKKVSRPVTRDGAKIVRAEAELLAPRDTGVMADKLAVRVAPKKLGVGHVAVTGTRKAMGIDGKAKWYYPALIEYGYRRHGVTYPARPFMRTAADSKENHVLSMMRRRLWAGILREAKRK